MAEQEELEAPYYMLECFPPREWDDCALFEASPSPEGVDSWTAGRRFPKPLPEPLEFLLDPAHNDQLRELHNTEALVITKRLLAALREAGIDNLDVYAAIIRHPGTGFVSQDYVAVNVVGVISAADLAQSQVVGGSPGNLIDTNFEGVAIDAAKTGGALMFRLAENTNALIVHERIRQHLLARGFNMLTFVPPERWLG